MRPQTPSLDARRSRQHWSSGPDGHSGSRKPTQTKGRAEGHTPDLTKHQSASIVNAVDFWVSKLEDPDNIVRPGRGERNAAQRDDAGYDSQRVEGAGNGEHTQSDLGFHHKGYRAGPSNLVSVNRNPASVGLPTEECSAKAGGTTYIPEIGTTLRDLAEDGIMSIGGILSHLTELHRQGGRLFNGLCLVHGGHAGKRVNAGTWLRPIRGGYGVIREGAPHSPPFLDKIEHCLAS